MTNITSITDDDRKALQLLQERFPHAPSALAAVTTLTQELDNLNWLLRTAMDDVDEINRTLRVKGRGGLPGDSVTAMLLREVKAGNIVRR